MPDIGMEGVAQDHDARAVPGRVDQPQFFPGPYDLEAGFLITREPVGIGRPLLHLLPPTGSDTEAGFIVGERAEHEATAHLLKASWELYVLLNEGLTSAWCDAAIGCSHPDPARAAKFRDHFYDWQKRSRATLAKARGEA